jgi:hypothetical protein
MTVFHPLPTPPRPASNHHGARFTPRAAAPEREFGTGYGRSSGYASARRYTTDWVPPRFRCA